jgi:hypothetical protein
VRSPHTHSHTHTQLTHNFFNSGFVLLLLLVLLNIDQLMDLPPTKKSKTDTETMNHPQEEEGKEDPQDPGAGAGLNEDEEMELLQEFASMLGPGFERTRDSCLRAFEDTVYYAHYGCIHVDGIADDHNETGFANFHESSFDNDGTPVILEDPIETEAKIRHRNLVEAEKWSKEQLEEAGLILSDLESGSPIFRGDATEDCGRQWVNAFHSHAGIEESIQCFPRARNMICAIESMRANRVHVIDCLPKSTVGKREHMISNESLTCIARRAGCISLDRDCYDVLRRLARDRIQELLVSCVQSSRESHRDVILARDVTKAFNESTKRELLGYGYRG